MTTPPTSGAPTLTVAEYAERWFATHCAPPFRSEYLREIRKASFRLYLLPTLGHLPLTAVDTPTLAATQRALFARKLAMATVRTAIGHFSEMWKSARADGLTTGRPHVDLAWPKHRKDRPKVFTPQERERVLAAVIGAKSWFVPQVALMMLAGLRPSEAAAARIEDFDIDTGRLDIRRALVAREQTSGKTRKSVRPIVLSPPLVEILSRHIRERGRQLGLMSLNRFGESIDTEHFATNYFKPLLLELGLKYRPPYAMRHTYITLALMEGASAAFVAEYCATSIQEIERSYLSWIGAVQEPVVAAKRMPAAFSRGEIAATRHHARGAV